MSSGAPRIRSLDGLRGVAAFVVLFYHLSLAARPELSHRTWVWLTQSPLKILFPGTESVLIFFVLSGLVVTLPALKQQFVWRRYYPQRLLRLYLPVIAALVFAVVLILLIPRDPSSMPAGSWMRDAQATSVNLWSVLSEASLARKSYKIDNVLWSLRWEVLFSALLPIFVWVALLLKKHATFFICLAVSASVLGRVIQNEALVYLPLFLVGAVLATRLGELAAPASKRESQWFPLLALLSGALLIASWWARPLHENQVVQDALWGLAGAGAVLIVVLAIRWPSMRRVLEQPFSQWLGKISFSLYLVHVPIIATLMYLFGQRAWWLACLVSVPASFVIAVLFQRFIEAPSHKLSRAVAAKVPVH